MLPSPPHNDDEEAHEDVGQLPPPGIGVERVVPRTVSAPPAFMNADTLFAFHRDDFARIFSDIRCDPAYPEFWKAQSDATKSFLPKPLEPPYPFFTDRPIDDSSTSTHTQVWFCVEAHKFTIAAFLGSDAGNAINRGGAGTNVRCRHGWSCCCGCTWTRVRPATVCNSVVDGVRSFLVVQSSSGCGLSDWVVGRCGLSDYKFAYYFGGSFKSNVGELDYVLALRRASEDVHTTASPWQCHCCNNTSVAVPWGFLRPVSYAGRNGLIAGDLSGHSFRHAAQPDAPRFTLDWAPPAPPL